MAARIKLVKDVQKQIPQGRVEFAAGATATIRVPMVSGSALVEFHGMPNVYVLVERTDYEILKIGAR